MKCVKCGREHMGLGRDTCSMCTPVDLTTVGQWPTGMMPSRKSYDNVVKDHMHVASTELNAERRRLWCDAVVAAIRFGRWGEDITKTADSVVAGFDERFA